MATNALASMFGRSNWNFETPDARNFTQPVAQGIEAGYRDRQQNVENERQNKLLDFQRQRLGMEQQKAAREDDDAKVQRMGREATAIMNIPEAQRAQVWNRWVQSNPDVASHAQRSGIDLADYRSGPQFIATQAGMYDADKKRLTEAQIGLTRAQTAASLRREEPEIVRQLRAAGIDPMSPQGRKIIQEQIPGQGPVDRLVNGIVSGGQGGQGGQPAAAPQPLLQPQSFEGGPQGGDPNLIRVQTAQAPGAQTPQQSTGSAFDGKSPEEKRRIAEALLLNPRTKALGEQLMKDVERDRSVLGKTATNDIDEKIVKGLDQVSRLEAMSQTFQDKYQTIGTRLKMTGTGWMAKIDPSKVSPADAKDLSAFAQDRRRGIENLNLTIKDITGAAMSIPEASRIMSQVPNPGTGILDGDDPITYRAKLKDAVDQTRLSIVRHAWLKKNNPQLLAQLAGKGMEGIESVMPLDRMRDMMNERKNQIYQQLKQRSPNATREQLLPFVGQQLNQEFGI